MGVIGRVMGFKNFESSAILKNFFKKISLKIHVFNFEVMCNMGEIRQKPGGISNRILGDIQNFPSKINEFHFCLSKLNPPIN
jgi:hypothetical protein